MNEPNQPNEYGFAGEGTAPQPAQAHPDPSSTTDEDGERTAVPADDLTGAVGDGLDDLTHRDRDTTDR